MTDERRSAKLHKQPEIEDDDDDTAVAPDDKSEAACASTVSPDEGIPVSGGVPTPTVQSASSSSGTSPEENQPKVVVPPPITRKQTLIRTQALDGTSPPPDSFFSQIQPNGAAQEGHLVANGAASDKTGKKKGASSAQDAKEFLLASHKVSSDSGHGTMDNDGSSDTCALSRDSSLENNSSNLYKDSSGVNIPKFMRETLNKSPKDRKTILAYEEKLLDFIKNGSMQTLKMAEMTSYDRMIVHRLAAYLGLEHNVDTSGKCVVLSKTENTRAIKLSEIVMMEDAAQEPKKRILLKKPASLDEKHGRGHHKAQFGSHRAKSLEERQQIYSEARERIFKNDENQMEGATAAPSLLSANYNPHIHQQRSLDSIKSNSHHSSKWASTESSGYESLKDSPNTLYSSPPLLPQGSQMSVASITPTDVHHLTSSPDTSASPMTQAHQCPTLAYLVSSDYSSIPVGSLIINPLTMQPHVNPDGSLYHFDPTCPPPFMVQPPTQPPPVTPPVPTNIIYQSDNVADLTARFAGASISPVEAAGAQETYTVNILGQAVPMVPAIVPHPQSIYTTHASQFTQSLAQGQYYSAPSPTGSHQQVRIVSFPVPQGQSQHQMLQAAPVDGQGQTTVPMPAVGIPAGYHMMGTPYQPGPGPVPAGNPPHCVDLGATAYHYGTVPENVTVCGGVSVNGAAATSLATGGGPHLVHAYSIGYQQPPQHPHQHSHATQFSPSAGTSSGAAYYTTVPVSTPTPPLALTQPPPSSHHHHQQQQQQQQQQPQQQSQHHHHPTVFYNPALGNLTVSPLTYPMPLSNPSTSSTSALKPMPAPFIQNPYRPSTPPPPQQLHHHHPQQPQQTVATSSNGHHPPHLTLNYGQPVTLTPGQPVAPLATPQGSQFVALQPNPYQRAVGTVIQLQGPQSVTGHQLQPYQIIRPAGPMQDVRMNPSAMRPHLSSLPFGGTHSQQTRPKMSNPNRGSKKGGKKPGGPRDAEDYSPGPQGSTAPQQMGAMSMVTPLIPSVAGPIHHPQSHLPSAPSNRQ